MNRRSPINAPDTSHKTPRVRLCRWLYPAAWLYGAGVGLRNKLFDYGWLPQESFDTPIICVGNLAVGGTGKTPHTEYIVRLLQNAGLNPATLSRGYKRHTRGYVLANENSTARDIGDEPLQMKRKFPDIRVAVDEDRRHGIRQLTALKHPPVDVVLLDDAYQHRYVRAGLNILLTEYRRLFCDDALLPAGRLREPAENKDRAQVIVVTKCPPDMTEEDCKRTANRLKLLPHQQLYFSTLRYGALYPLCSDKGMADRPPLDTDTEVLLLTGIASPQAILEEVRRHTPQVSLLTFADHHDFSTKDLKLVTEQFDKLTPGRRLIVTTEKDAARLSQHPALDENLKSNICVLPVEVDFLQNKKQTFNQTIIDYVRTHSRNSNLP